MTEPSIEERLGKLETEVESVGRTVGRLSQSFDSFAVETRRSIGSIQRTPWGVLAAWTGVAITVVCSVGAIVSYGQAREISRLDGDLEFETSRRLTHQDQLGHPALTVRVHALENALKEMDVKIQREIYLSDDKLQIEIKLVNEVLGEQIRALERISFDGKGEMLP